MAGQKTVKRVKMLLPLAILMLAIWRPAAMRQTVAGLEIASITPKRR